MTSQVIQMMVDRWGGAAVTSCTGVKDFAAVGVSVISSLELSEFGFKEG